MSKELHRCSDCVKKFECFFDHADYMDEPCECETFESGKLEHLEEEWVSRRAKQGMSSKMITKSEHQKIIKHINKVISRINARVNE